MLASHEAGHDFWLFAYGSLMWNPAIRTAGYRTALLRGWHRRFCLWLVMGRGSPEHPGLMLALARGGACYGVAWRIAAEQARHELLLVWRREMFGRAIRHAGCGWPPGTDPFAPSRSSPTRNTSATTLR